MLEKAEWPAQEFSEEVAVISPNLITLVRIVLAFISVALFRQGAYAGLAALLVVALALDAIDGYVAQRSGRASDADVAFDRVMPVRLPILPRIARLKAYTGSTSPRPISSRSGLQQL